MHVCVDSAKGGSLRVCLARWAGGYKRIKASTSSGGSGAYLGYKVVEVQSATRVQVRLG